MVARRIAVVAAFVAVSQGITTNAKAEQLVKQRIETALRRANTVVHAAGLARECPMGTAAIVAALHPSEHAHHVQLTFGWLADARAYLVSPAQTAGHSFRRLTEDHDIYTNNLGFQPDATLHFGHQHVRVGSLLLLCTDGLTPKGMDERQLRTLITRSAPPAQKGACLHNAARSLIGAANDNGGPDNVTALLAYVQRAGPKPLIQIAGATHQGLVRSDNQDALVHRTVGNTNYLVVADGMSKAHPEGPYVPEGGDAARIAADTILEIATLP